MRQLALLITTVALVLAATALPAAAADRFAIGLGAGVVEPDGGGEIYFMGAFRFRIGGGNGGDADEGEWDPRGRPPRGTSPGVRAYVEPEVGYWSLSEDGGDASDLLVGVNLVGVMPSRHVDYFFGIGFGLHFLDVEVQGFPELSEDDSVLGGNLQLGLDLRFSEHLGIFGAARIDLLDSDRYSDQFKVYGGLRLGF